jgi:hypothetical protein
VNEEWTARSAALRCFCCITPQRIIAGNPPNIYGCYWAFYPSKKRDKPPLPDFLCFLVLIMIHFTFRFRNYINRAVAVMISDQDDLRYEVNIGNDQWFTILPSGIPEPSKKTVWVQSDEPDEIVQPKELIQALGEGIENLDKYSASASMPKGAKIYL